MVNPMSNGLSCQIWSLLVKGCENTEGGLILAPIAEADPVVGVLKFSTSYLSYSKSTEKVLIKTVNRLWRVILFEVNIAQIPSPSRTVTP